jgi:7-carboxy-7-deazaguanine synthase
VTERLRVVERFDSVQGEGLLVGTPSRFIRLSGCNLRCVWCDTPESSWEPAGEHVPIETLVRECAGGPRHVVVTGGEPMLFAGTTALTRALRRQGHHVTIETAGTCWLDDLEVDLMSISPKLAHSTPWSRDTAVAERHERARLASDTTRRLLDGRSWQLKYVVRASAIEEDLAEVLDHLRVLGVPASAADRVLLMPECVEPARLAEDYVRVLPACSAHGFRLGERLHLHLFGHRPGT